MNLTPGPSCECSGTETFGGATEMNIMDISSHTGSCHLRNPEGTFVVLRRPARVDAALSFEVKISRPVSNFTFFSAASIRTRQSARLNRLGLKLRPLAIVSSLRRGFAERRSHCVVAGGGLPWSPDSML